MEFLRLLAWSAAVSCASAMPAFAAVQNVEVAEPNMVTILALACAGVLIGRRMAAQRPPRD